MGLEDFDSDAGENEWHPNDKLNKRKLWIDKLCPECGREGELTEYGYYRCPRPSDECEVVTWRSAQRREDGARV